MLVASELHCSASANLDLDKFVPFKTPLCELYNDQIPEQYRFTPRMFIQSMESVGKLGLWIDLTNTDRFYDRRDIELEEIRYYKINCRGHGEAPGVDAVEEFIRVCQGHTREHPRDLIAVHCTHGFNRTGFLICAYLIVAKDWE